MVEGSEEFVVLSRVPGERFSRPLVHFLAHSLHCDACGTLINLCCDCCTRSIESSRTEQYISPDAAPRGLKKQGALEAPPSTTKWKPKEDKARGEPSCSLPSILQHLELGSRSCGSSGVCIVFFCLRERHKHIELEARSHHLGKK